MFNSTEFKRKSVHIASVFFALLIGRIPAWAISAACLFVFFLNVTILPRLTRHALERQEDRHRGFPLGILAYPAILFLISLIFYQHQVFLAIAWGMMAFGDGFAGIAGGSSINQKYFHHRSWPWNRDKTLAGSLGFVLFGSILTLSLIYLLPLEMRLGLTFQNWYMILFLTALISAWVETLPGLIDDNLSVPFIASLFAYLLVLFYQLPAVPPVQDMTPWIIASAVLSVLTVITKKMTLSGALVGLLIACLIILGAGKLGFVLLASFFLLGTLVSQWAKKWKQDRGLAQEQGGKRSVRHAIANGGVAAIGGILAWIHPSPLLILAIAGSFAAATSDTFSSELGNRYGRHFYDILSFQPATRGRDGVVSLPGSLAGVAGSLCVSLIYLAIGGQVVFAGIVFFSGLAGNAMDSILGATLQRRGYMTNDSVNFTMALSGFVAAFTMGMLI
jgi:uncharacterized protein (TIGR00297 family)